MRGNEREDKKKREQKGIARHSSRMSQDASRTGSFMEEDARLEIERQE